MLQDVAKSSVNYKQLQDEYRALKNTRRFDIDESFQSPAEELRRLIPDIKISTTRGVAYAIDPALNLRAGNEEAWDRYYDEGRKVADHFNRRLSIAIGLDKSGTSARYVTPLFPFLGHRFCSCLSRRQEN